MARNKRYDALPPSLPPIGLSRETVAAFINVSPSKFDEMVKDGRMPTPRRVDARRIWYRPEVEAAFAALVSDEDHAAAVGQEEGDWEASNSPRVAANPEVSQWERVLLTGVYKRDVDAVDATTVEGAGPATRQSLERKGLIKDDGTKLSLTSEGRSVAKRVSRLPGVERRHQREIEALVARPLSPDRGPEWHSFVQYVTEKDTAKPLGKRERDVLRQLVQQYGGLAEHYQLRGAGAVTAALLYARGLIELVTWRGAEHIRVTARGRIADRNKEI